MLSKFVNTLFVFVVCCVSGSAYSNDYNPAVLWPGSGEISKNPFSIQVYEGVSLFESFQNAPVQKYRGPGKQRSAESILREAAELDSNPIFSFGYSYTDALLRVAPDYPHIQFIAVDAGFDEGHPDNIAVVEFANEEGAFLMGILAAYTTKSNKLGFIGGMDVDSIRDYGCGYIQGALSINSDIQFEVDMISDSALGFDDPETALSIARAHYQSGVDIVFPAAGASGLGVFEAAEQSRAYAIGVDANQNGLSSGRILSSLLKRIDIITYQLLKRAAEGQKVSRYLLAGVREGAFDWIIDEHNLDFINLAVKNAMDRAKAEIASGKTRVQKYRSSDLCQEIFGNQM